MCGAPSTNCEVENGHARLLPLYCLTIFSFAKNCNEFFNLMALGQFFTSALSNGLSMFRLTLVSFYIFIRNEDYTVVFELGTALE
jgi:hypothetical protein